MRIGERLEVGACALLFFNTNNTFIFQKIHKGIVRVMMSIQCGEVTFSIACLLRKNDLTFSPISFEIIWLQGPLTRCIYG